MYGQIEDQDQTFDNSCGLIIFRYRKSNLQLIASEASIFLNCEIVLGCLPPHVEGVKNAEEIARVVGRFELENLLSDCLFICLPKL